MGTRRFLLAALLGAAALPGCSAVQTPFVEPLRFPLSPIRTGPPRTGYGRRTLLLRIARAAPGLEGRLLRTVRADGTVGVEYYAEWTAPPAEAAEEAVRRWLVASGLYAAVLTPGTRATPSLTLELELSALHADLGRGEARAALSAVLLREGTSGATVVAQSVNVGTAPLPAERPLPPAEQARATVEALGRAIAKLEIILARHAR